MTIEQDQKTAAEPPFDCRVRALDETLELAHREAWRYKKSSSPHHSDTYTFNRETLLEFARKLVIAERESRAAIADKYSCGTCGTDDKSRREIQMRCCKTCRSWHKRDNYACKFNGPYGGGTDGIEGCKWKPKKKVVPNAELKGGL